MVVISLSSASSTQCHVGIDSGVDNSLDDSDRINAIAVLFVDLIQTLLNRSPTQSVLWSYLQALTMPLLSDTPLHTMWDSEKITNTVTGVQDWVWQVKGFLEC